jgi:hypothetical protein
LHFAVEGPVGPRSLATVFGNVFFKPVARLDQLRTFWRGDEPFLLASRFTSLSAIHSSTSPQGPTPPHSCKSDDVSMSQL